MNTFILLMVLALAGVATADTYTDRYDDLNVDEILANKKILVPYIKCMLDQGRCVPEGQELKGHIKEAMQNGCEKCTDKQKVKAKKVVKYMREKEQDYYKQLVAKYDPEDKYRETYEAFLAAE